MSEYFRALKRLKSNEPVEYSPPKAERASAAWSGPARNQAKGASPQPLIAEPAEIELRPALPAAQPAAVFSRVFENLRGLTTGAPARMLVFSSAAASESVRPVTAAVAAQAVGLGLKMRSAVLDASGGSAILRSSCPSPDASPLRIDLQSPSWQSSFADWVRDEAADANLMIIEAPSLEASVDAALLACACDGLVIVAQAEVTAREALQAAAERARVVGCRPLGVALHRTRDRVPAWLRRLVGRSTTSMERDG